jgi:hypothetical protein
MQGRESQAQYVFSYACIANTVGTASTLNRDHSNQSVSGYVIDEGKMLEGYFCAL